MADSIPSSHRPCAEICKMASHEPITRSIIASRCHYCDGVPCSGAAGAALSAARRRSASSAPSSPPCPPSRPRAHASALRHAMTDSQRHVHHYLADTLRHQNYVRHAILAPGITLQINHRRQSIYFNTLKV